MPQIPRLNTITFVAVAIVFFIMLCGCMVPFYGYPTASCTPPVSVAADGDQVFAFRMDIKRQRGTVRCPYPHTEIAGSTAAKLFEMTPQSPIYQNLFSTSYQSPFSTSGDDLIRTYTPRATPMPGKYAVNVESDGTPFDDEYASYSFVPISASGQVSPLFTSGIANGLYVSGIGLKYVAHTRHTVSLALYRPGYELVIVPSWDLLPNVEWKACVDLVAQGRVLDFLFVSAVAGNNKEDDPHVKALRFGASEYDRLALLAKQQNPLDETLAARLEAAAAKLRKLATGSYSFN